MALVRKGDRVYLIRSIRINGRPTSRCLASGEQAEKLHLVEQRSARGRRADLVEERRLAQAHQAEMRALDREIRRQAKRNDGRGLWREIDREMTAMVESSRSEAAGLMRAAGYHQHRWIWRKRRRGNQVTSELTQRLENETAVAKALGAVASAQGAVEHVDALEKYDRDHPGEAVRMVETSRKVFLSDPAVDLLEKLLKRQGGSDVRQELLRRQYDEVRRELEGPTPTPIERHLAERAALCWLDANGSHALAIHGEQSNLFMTAEKEFRERSADRAHRRYLTALRTLALIRSKALPSLRLQVAVKNRDGTAAAAMVEMDQSSA